MLKKRVIGMVIIKDSLVVQSRSFNTYLPIGRPSIVIEYLNSWGIDEILVLDISRSPNRAEPDLQLLNSYAPFCRVPLAYGGGITSLDQVHSLIESGCDKVVLNQSALTSPELITKVADVYGSQCVICCIDVFKNTKKSVYQVYNYMGKQTINCSPSKLAHKYVEYGAGEILYNFVDCDGSLMGYDIFGINFVSSGITVPIIVCGGAGRYDHILQVISLTEASGIAAANFFHYTEHSITKIKSLCLASSLPIRSDTGFTYENHSFDPNTCRLNKPPEIYLDELLFTKQCLKKI